MGGRSCSAVAGPPCRRKRRPDASRLALGVWVQMWEQVFFKRELAEQRHAADSLLFESLMSVSRHHSSILALGRARLRVGLAKASPQAQEAERMRLCFTRPSLTSLDGWLLLLVDMMGRQVVDPSEWKRLEAMMRLTVSGFDSPVSEVAQIMKVRMRRRRRTVPDAWHM